MQVLFQRAVEVSRLLCHVCNDGVLLFLKCDCYNGLSDTSTKFKCLSWYIFEVFKFSFGVSETLLELLFGEIT